MDDTVLFKRRSHDRQVKEELEKNVAENVELNFKFQIKSINS